MFRAGTDIVSRAARDRVQHYLNSLKQYFAGLYTVVSSPSFGIVYCLLNLLNFLTFLMVILKYRRTSLAVNTITVVM